MNFNNLVEKPKLVRLIIQQLPPTPRSVLPNTRYETPTARDSDDYGGGGTAATVTKLKKMMVVVMTGR